MAAIAHGTDELVKYCAEMLSKLPPIKKYEAEPEAPIDIEKIEDRTVNITNHDGVYFVEADWLLHILRIINFDDYEGLQYFQRVLQNSGVIDALVAAGVAEGDTVSIYDIEFEFVF